MKPGRVLFISSHTLFLSSLAARLGQFACLRVVGMARTIGEAFGAIARRKPDLAVLDLDAADPAFLRGGAISKIGGQGLPIVCVSSTLDDDLVQKVLAAGARGLLQKSDVHESIGQALGDVLAGGAWFPAEVVARVVIASAGVQLVR